MNSDILIISNDEPMNRLMHIDLKREGYSVVSEQNSATGFAIARTTQLRLLLLDERVPGLSTLEFCSRLRSLSTTLKIILLTNTNQVRLTDLPIDDFFLTPLRMAELLPRIALNLRKPAPTNASILIFEDLSLDLDNHEVYRSRRLLDLTLTEFDLLACLLCHPQQVVHKDRLLEKVWNETFVGNHNLLHVYIRSLRNKLEANGEDRLIHTVRGVGYILKTADQNYLTLDSGDDVAGLEE